MRKIYLFVFIIFCSYSAFSQHIGFGVKAGAIRPYYVNSAANADNRPGFSGGLFGDILYGKDMTTAGLSFMSLKHRNTDFNFTYEYQYFTIPLHYNRFVIDWVAVTGGLEGSFMYRTPDGVMGSDFKYPYISAAVGGRIDLSRNIFIGALANFGLHNRDNNNTGIRLNTYSLSIGASSLR